MVDDDEKWIKKAQNGNRNAFDNLIKKYSPRIYYLLLDMTSNTEDAQDLTQETFLKAFQKIGGYRSEAMFSTWLYRIAYNIGIDFARRKKRRRSVGLDHFMMKKTPDNNEYKSNGIDIWEKEAVTGALKKLTHSQRAATILYYYHGFRMKEIGEILGCREATARVHLFRALGRLRLQLKDYSREKR